MPLHQSIYQFARQVEEAGLSRIEIFPLFLLPGVHVKEDIPREVGLARQLLGKTVDLKLWAYLGSYPILKQLLKKQLIDLPAEGKILLSHGSRRPGGNYPCEAIAREIGGISAYWSVPPCLTQQVEKLVADGVRSIAILPYFLFPGGITDAIARSVSQLEQRFPQVRFSLGEPLGTLPELGHFIVEEIA